MFGPGDCCISVNADWALEPTFDTTWTAVQAVDDPVVKVMAMLPPWAEPEAFTVRSGAMAAFQTSRVLLVAFPDCASVGPPVPLMMAETSTSYQRASTPSPPDTAWAVQYCMWFARLGSLAATACSSRPSSVSRRLLVWHWRPLGGLE